MSKKFTLVFFMILFFAFTGETRTHLDYIDSGKRIGVQSGEIFNLVARDALKAKEVPEFMAAADMLEALRMGRVDAVLTDSSYAKQLQDSGMFPDFDYLLVPKDIYTNRSSPVFHTTALRDQFNVWLAKIKADGTLDDMINRWIGVSLPNPQDIPKIELTGENGVLKVCDTGSFPPFTYLDAQGNPTGFDFEMISRFAQYLGKSLNITMMSYDAIPPYVISGKADMSACLLTITAERGKSMIFSEPVIDTQAVLIVPKIKRQGRNYTDFNNTRIGSVTGSFFYPVIEDVMHSTAVYYSDVAAGLEDLRRGRIDGYMTDLSQARVIAGSAGGESMELLDVPAEIFIAPMGAISLNQELIDRFNKFLAELKADGTLNEMQGRWLDNVPDLDAPMPNLQSPRPNGTLRIVTTGATLPFSYIGANGELKGYSIELIQRFAAHIGMDIEFATVDFSGFIPYVMSGRADMGIDCISITEERKKSVIFSDSIYDDRFGLLVLRTEEYTPKRDYTYFRGRNIANITGVLTYITTEKIGANVVYYNEASPAVVDIRQGRLDGFMHAYSTVRVMAEQLGNDTFEAIPVPKKYFSAQVAGISHDQAVIDRFNIFLAKLKADGTLTDMQNRWFGEEINLNAPMPDIPSSGVNGILRVVTNSDCLPYAYVGENGEMKGFSVELAKRFAAHEGKIAEFANVEFSGLIPYTISGKADISLANMAITEERKKSVFFTDSFFDEQHGILALKAADMGVKTQTGGGFINWFKVGVERNLITDNRWKLVISGLQVTILISLLAQFFGTIFGGLVCFFLMRENIFAKTLANLYCTLINGTPIVVLLMITYYIIFGNTNISNIFVAVVAFTMVMGVGIGGTLKGAIDTIDVVEIEAARSIGFSAFSAFVTITLPQAIRRALPSYTNGFVELMKATAIVGFIAVQDLTRAGDIIRSRTYDAYFPLLLVAVIYLTITTICVQLFKIAIKRVNTGEVAK